MDKLPIAECKVGYSYTHTHTHTHCILIELSQNPLYSQAVSENHSTGFNGCPVAAGAAGATGSHAYLWLFTDAITNELTWKMHACPEMVHTKKKFRSPPECQSGSNSDIVMENRWHLEASCHLLFFHSSVKENGERPHTGSSSPHFYLTLNWNPNKGRTLLTKPA